MLIQVNKERCTGCGVCLDACSLGAIQLVDHCAVINDELCTQCQACADACPNEAITAILEPTQSTSLVTLPETDARAIPVQQPGILPAMAVSARRLAPLAGSVLAYLGHEVAPQLVDIIINAAERRLSQSTPSPTTALPNSTRRPTAQRKGERRQTRYRRGQPGPKNLDDRR